MDEDGFPILSRRWNPRPGTNPRPVFESNRRISQGRKYTKEVSVRPGCNTSFFKQQFTRRLQNYSQKIPKKYARLPEPLGEIIFSLKIAEVLKFGLAFPDRNFCRKAIEESKILKYLCRVTTNHFSPGMVIFDEENGCCSQQAGVELLNPRKDSYGDDSAQFEKFFATFHLQVFLWFI